MNTSYHLQTLERIGTQQRGILLSQVNSRWNRFQTVTRKRANVCKPNIPSWKNPWVKENIPLEIREYFWSEKKNYSMSDSMGHSTDLRLWGDLSILGAYLGRGSPRDAADSLRQSQTARFVSPFASVSKPQDFKRRPFQNPCICQTGAAVPFRTAEFPVEIHLSQSKGLIKTSGCLGDAHVAVLWTHCSVFVLMGLQMHIFLYSNSKKLLVNINIWVNIFLRSYNSADGKSNINSKTYAFFFSNHLQCSESRRDERIWKVNQTTKLEHLLSDFIFKTT